ncbi:MAG: TetR/AcrR family transcriptional regulator [Bacillota bacterium]|nr:TetR/AcrR family transcriptional regulator [Bacillota bacterium]
MDKKTRLPKQRRAIENKALLLEAAKKLFTEKGYLNTNSNEIVKEAGISIGTFYAYYKDKKEVFMEIIDEYTREYNMKLEEALNSIRNDNDRDYLKAIILATMDISKKYYGFEDELIAMRYTDNDIKLQNEINQKYIISKIKGMLNRMHFKNQNQDIAAFLLFCLVDNFSYNIVHQSDLDVDASVEHCIDMILSYTKT